LQRQFSEEQQRAIAVNRLGEDACIVAGPGSGKTTVLVERFRQLVLERGVHSGRILAITFTEKAASNMRERLEKALGSQLERANVSTVHGFCYRLIREHAIEAGVDPGAAILDEGKGVLLRKRCLEQALDSLLQAQAEAARRLIRSLGADAAKLIDTYDAIRSAGADVHGLREYRKPSVGDTLQEIAALMETVRGIPFTPVQRGKVASLHEWHERLTGCADVQALRLHLLQEPFNLTQVRKPELSTAVLRIRELQKEMLADCVTEAHAADRNSLISVLERFDVLYSAAKRERGMLDFSDLEFYAVRLLETHPAIQRKLREQFQQVMMDEFQDTNGQQEKLMALLRGPDRFYAVGDINQSIFGFRHTTPEVFARYRDQVQQTGKHHVELVENWRSRPEILLAVETVVADRDGVVPRDLIAAKEWPRKRVPSVEVIAIEQPEEADGTAIEAQWVAQRMLELRGKLSVGDRRADYRDMAVLVRNSVVFREFAEAFEKAGIPYKQSRKRGFLETREALDLTHLLRVIANPRDEISLTVVLRSPLVQLSDESILRLQTVAKNLGDALSWITAEQEAGFDALDRVRLQAFRERLAGWRRAYPHISLDRLLLRAMDECGYSYEPDTDSGNTIDKFLDSARAADVPLEEFNDELELLREVDTGEPEAPLDTSDNSVRMMTAHSAKGLEFPIVFVASMNKGTKMDSPPFSFTPEHGFGATWRTAFDVTAQADAFHAANCRAISAREEQESNRLLYVAMTRAEEHLILSYSTDNRSKNWGGHVRKLLVKPFPDVPFDQPTDVQVPHPDGRRTFAVRVLRSTQAPVAKQASFTFGQSGGAEQITRPVLMEQHDSSVTVTAVATFAACPRRYYLAHELGWEQQRPVRLAERGEDFEQPAAYANEPADELGREVHRLLSNLPAGDLDDPSNLLATNLGLELAQTFRKHPLGERASRAERIEREWSFNFAVDDVVVSGQVDLWFVENSGVVLVDYKTNDVDLAGASTAAGTYAAQIQLYALCIERATGLPVREAYLHFLRPNAAIPITPDSQAAIRAVRNLARAQELCKFPLHVAEHCRRCPFYKNLCPADLNSSQEVA